MFERTQKFECLGPKNILNTPIEKEMCKFCLNTEVPEGQRVANTTSSLINEIGSFRPIPWLQMECSAKLIWWKSVGPGEWSTCPATPQGTVFNNGLLPAHRADCLLLAIEGTTQKWGDRGKRTHCLPNQCHSQAVGPLASLMGSPSSFHHPLPWGAFPLFHLTDLCPGSSPQPHSRVGSSLTFYHLASHLPGGSSTKCRPSLNGTFPSDLHLQLFCQSTQRKPMGQNAMAAICNRGILI